jgi:CRP-like cAMP-binding protein
MAIQKAFKAGEVLFRQGDASNCVLRVESGKVEILREVGDIAVVLGEVQAGEWLGEMGVLENRSRSATARAMTDISVEELNPQEFLREVCGDPDLSRDLILRLSVRLRSVEDKIAEGLFPFAQTKHAAAPAAADTQSVHIALAPRTDALRARMGLAPVSVPRLPFLVGRAPAADRQPARMPDLAITDHEPFRLSREHFMIIRQQGQILVVDLGSALGTVVNGQPIGTSFPRDEAPLHAGGNLVIAGGQGSPFEFTVTLS